MGVQSPLSHQPRIDLERFFDQAFVPPVNGEICTGDVCRLGTGDKCDQGSDLINSSVTVKRCDCLLRCCLIARSRIEVCIDRTRLHVVHRDASAPNLSGQALRKHLHSTLGRRVRR